MDSVSDQLRDSGSGLSRSQKEKAVIFHSSPRESRGPENTCEGNGSCALDVIVEAAHLLAGHPVRNVFDVLKLVFITLLRRRVHTIKRVEILSLVLGGRPRPKVAPYDEDETNSTQLPSPRVKGLDCLRDASFLAWIQGIRTARPKLLQDQALTAQASP